jgi:hypothetical protein
MSSPRFLGRTTGRCASGWQNGSAEFSFGGLFAERRARLAEEGLRHLVDSSERAGEKPRRGKAKAAGA